MAGSLPIPNTPSAITVLVTGAGAVDTVVNNEGGAINDTNVKTQLSAAAISQIPALHPAMFVSHWVASSAAFSTASIVLANDIMATTAAH